MEKKQALKLFERVGTPIIGAWTLFLLWREGSKALRARKQPRKERLFLNTKVATTAAVGLRFALIPALVASAQQAQEKQQGLLPRLPVPAPVKATLAFLALDYGNYLWHTLNHRFKFLWRFHNVHHTDLDLDITTAWRFHLGEVLASVLFRGAVARVVGPTAATVLLYEFFYEAANAFHHSNWRLSYQLEKGLSKVIVTPRMHGVHHSIVLRETNSNFSVIFSLWDRLHQTLKLNVPQHDINIGVPAYRQAEELTFQRLLVLPFTPVRPWKLPTGEEPTRGELARPETELAE